MFHRFFYYDVLKVLYRVESKERLESIVKELCGSLIFVDQIARLNKIKRSTPLEPKQFILIDCLTDDDELNTDRYRSVYMDKNQLLHQLDGNHDRDEDEDDESAVDKVRIIFRRPYTTDRHAKVARNQRHNHHRDEKSGGKNEKVNKALQAKDELRPAKIFFKPKEFDSEFASTSRNSESEEDNDREEKEQMNESK